MARLLGTGAWFGCAVTMAAGTEDISRLPDPTRPYTGPVEVEPSAVSAGPVLQSTMISPTVRRAVISGRSYRVGDRIDGGVVTDIQPYEVAFKHGDRETRLRLFPRVVKDPKTPPGKDG